MDGESRLVAIHLYLLFPDLPDFGFFEADSFLGFNSTTA